jgi:branched-subunit amino acid transport protein
MSWLGVLLVALIAYSTKLAGIIIPNSILERPYVSKLAVLLPVALLSALTAIQVFGSGQSLVIDARFAGLSAGVVAYFLKAPFILIVLVAALTTALLRFFFGVN